MITSNQILSLFEEYYTRHNINGHDVIIYMNPTSSDYNNLRKETQVKGDLGIRYLVNYEKKQVYVWNAYLAIHKQVIDACNNPNIGWINTVYGDAILKQNSSKAVATTCRAATTVNTNRFSWADRFLQGVSLTLPLTQGQFKF
jgi:hypothetical protein